MPSNTKTADCFIEEIKELIEETSKTVADPLLIDRDFVIHKRDANNHDEVPNEKPKDCVVVYGFLQNNDEFLKIGKTNRKTKFDRFRKYHYGCSKSSTLARSICVDEFPNKECKECTHKGSEIGKRIKSETVRIDIMIKRIDCNGDDVGHWRTALIEGILHYRYKPKYEKG